MSSDLKSLLTADLFHFCIKSWLPIGPKDPIDDFGQAIQAFLFKDGNGPNGPKNARPRVWPCLEAISKLGLDVVNGVDWLSFLPPAEDPDFPTQALGLQLLLDQAPRSYLKGKDNRWTNAYFDPLATKLALSLQALPPHLRPTSWERWKDVTSFEYFIFLRFFYSAPIVHNETQSDVAVAFSEESRLLIEDRYKTRDPLRDLPEKRWDMYGFPRLIQSGGPKGPVDAASGGFWLLNLMDTHKPPLDRFGRYPYRNWVLGRDMTKEEEEWLAEAELFKPPPDEVIQKIREDVAQGVWSPFGIDSQ